MRIFYFDEFSRTTKLKPPVEMALWLIGATAVVTWIAVVF